MIMETTDDRLDTTPAADPLLGKVTTEWGVRNEQGGKWKVTACESEEAAKVRQADAGGELVVRSTYT